MGVKSTMPFQGSLVPPSVQTLKLNVVEGPDAGLTIDADSEVLTVGSAKGNDVVLTDPTVSRYHLELNRDDEGVRVVDYGSTNGTFCGPVRVRDAHIPAGARLRLGRSLVVVDAGKPAQVPEHADDTLCEIRGRTSVMRRLMARVKKAAATEAAVLVVGESGTGKELIARALHELGPRGDGPFVTVDCGALAPNLVASELFGHEKGAFTGADRRHPGAFERANGGTLFLDEIGELPRDLQPTLLGALERKTFRRVGGQEELSVDVRVIAATHRDLRAEVNAGTFRLDLYYRLAIVTLRVPSLRERLDDVPLLIEHFARESGHDASIEELFGEDVIDTLRSHRFPGNVRELRNLVEASLAMGEAPDLHDVYSDASIPPDHDDDGDRGAIALRPLLGLGYKDARTTVLSEFESRFARHWLDQSGGNVAQAARDGRINRSHLFNLIKRHKLR